MTLMNINFVKGDERYPKNIQKIWGFNQGNSSASYTPVCFN